MCNNHSIHISVVSQNDVRTKLTGIINYTFKPRDKNIDQISGLGSFGMTHIAKTKNKNKKNNNNRGIPMLTWLWHHPEETGEKK